MDWIYLEHEDTGGTTRVPDEDGVVQWYEGRGWKQVDEPKPGPFVPPKGDVPPEDDGWVELVHLESGGSHRFPNNPEALEGAYEAGWQLPKPGKAKKKASVEPATDTNEAKE